MMLKHSAAMRILLLWGRIIISSGMLMTEMHVELARKEGRAVGAVKEFLSANIRQGLDLI